jgi:hypothetical protein
MGRAFCVLVGFRAAMGRIPILARSLGPLAKTRAFGMTQTLGGVGKSVL